MSVLHIRWGKAAFRNLDRTAVIAGPLTADQTVLDTADSFASLITEKYATLDTRRDHLQWFMLGSALRCGEGSTREPELGDE